MTFLRTKTHQAMIAMNKRVHNNQDKAAASRLREEFVDYLLGELTDCFSLSEMSPQCPYCQNSTTYLIKRGGKPSSELPKFRCEACNRMFSRLTGSVFSHINRSEFLPGFIKQLPQQKSYRLAARELGCEWRLLWRWTMKLKKWLATHENGVQWTECIRLGYETMAASGRRTRPPIGPLEPEIMRLRFAGHAIGTIATRLGLNHATVAKVIQHYNSLSAGVDLPPRRRPGRPLTITFSTEIIREVERRRADGQKLTKIARELNLPYEPLSRQCRRARAVSDWQSEE
ncbi:transposase-like protein [Ochrobactrum sp. 19YEA23]|nr:transposase-like protein [Ochrobactrum sp. 19YEA23]